jgi:hypothetical protein
MLLPFEERVLLEDGHALVSPYQAALPSTPSALFGEAQRRGRYTLDAETMADTEPVEEEEDDDEVEDLPGLSYGARDSGLGKGEPS